jgi:hypothetical protein
MSTISNIQLVLKKMKYVRSDDTLYNANRENSRIQLLLEVVKACKGPGLKKQKLKKSIKGLLRDSENEQKADQVAFYKNNSYESMVNEAAQVSLSSEDFEKI